MKSRYYRIFRNDGKALILAFNHGSGGKFWVDPANVIKQVEAGGMDAVLSTYGVIKNFRKEIGKMGAIVSSPVLGSDLAVSHPLDRFKNQPMSSPYRIEDYLRLGVDGVMNMGIIGKEFDSENMRFIAGVAAACDKYGLISAAEMLPNGFSSDPDDRTVEKMNIGCRVAAEIGIDFIKTVFVPPAEEYKKIVANTYVPILALGGEKAKDDRAALQNAKDAMDAGCKGLVVGRNVWQHKNIAGISAALSMIVHENASVSEALEALK